MIFAETMPQFLQFLLQKCRNFSHLGLSQYRDFLPTLLRKIFAPDVQAANSTYSS
jgi:hypothetical protein